MRNAVANGSAELPTLAASSALPSQAAPICLRSMFASAMASENASSINCSLPTSQRSPNREQPMPRMATLSLMPVAIDASVEWQPAAYAAGMAFQK
jgi:hypothetical protein